MLGEQSSIFPKQIKLDDYAELNETNVLRILQTSNLLIGTGARTSNAAIVLAKTLHFLDEEGIFIIHNKSILQLGSGVGLVSIYLACLGSNVTMADVPSMRQLAQRNISLNKKILKGKIEFVIANWRNQKCIGKCQEISEAKSSTSSEKKEECLPHLIDKIDLTIVCECGGLTDLQHFIKWMGKEGLLVCFLQRSFEMTEDFLSARSLQEYLLERELNYEKLEQYHPDYVDERVHIYHIWK